MPTLADALGVPQDPEWQGASLIPLANGQGGYPVMSFSSQYEDWHAGRIGTGSSSCTARTRRTCSISRRTPTSTTTSTARPEIGARLLLDPMWTLRQWNIEWKKAQWGNASNVSSRFAADIGE